MPFKKEIYGIEYIAFNNVSGKKPSEYSPNADLTINLYPDSGEYEKNTLAKCNDFSCFKFINNRKMLFVTVSTSIKFSILSEILKLMTWKKSLLGN